MGLFGLFKSFNKQCERERARILQRAGRRSRAGLNIFFMIISFIK